MSGGSMSGGSMSGGSGGSGGSMSGGSGGSMSGRRMADTGGEPVVMLLGGLTLATAAGLLLRRKVS